MNPMLPSVGFESSRADTGVAGFGIRQWACLSAADYWVVNLSGGKDSAAMLDVVVRAADGLGVRSRLVALHLDLGVAVFPGTRELAAEHAGRYGLRFEVRRRERGDLLEQIEARGRFPSARCRYCTSDQKTSVARKFMTELVRERRRECGLDRPVRLLNILGERAAESPARSRRPALEFVPAASTKTTRQVWTWRPVLHFSEQEVWRRVTEAGLPMHPAYRQGPMSRLSCTFCILASRSDLLAACRLRPDLAERYAQLEERIGHRFRADVSMRQLIELASRTCGEAADVS